jgi:hypothetical protein
MSTPCLSGLLLDQIQTEVFAQAVCRLQAATAAVDDPKEYRVVDPTVNGDPVPCLAGSFYRLNYLLDNHTHNTTHIWRLVKHILLLKFKVFSGQYPYDIDDIDDQRGGLMSFRSFMS